MSPPKGSYGLGKYRLLYTKSFLSIQLLNELSYPFSLTYKLSPFLLITFSILILLDLFFAILFHRIFQ